MAETGNPFLPLRRVKMAGAVALLLLMALVAIGFLAFDVREKIRETATASSDNVQWSLAQVEVEYMLLDQAMMMAAEGRGGDLSALRRSFDIFYSRLKTMADSRVFAPLRSAPGFSGAFQKIETYIAGLVPLIDGPPADLEAALPSVLPQLRSLREDVRVMSLTAIGLFARQADLNRQDIAATLLNVALLTSALVALVLGTVVALLRLDRSNQQRAEENRATVSRLEAIVSTALDAVLVVDRAGKIIDMNAAAEQVFGFDRAQALGAPMADLVIPEAYREAHAAGMRRYLASGQKKVVDAGRLRLEARRADGAVFPAEVSIATAYATDGEIFIAFVRDLSAQVAAERDLLKARDEALAGEKAKARLLAVMSHEMRTPLNGLLGTMELLADDGLTARQRDYLRIMESSGRLLLYHVNDVLNIARLDAGQQGFDRHFIDLREVLNDIAESQASLCRANGNRLVLKLPEDGSCCIMGDQIRLRQILLNLIGNALKFTRNGTVTVEVEHVVDEAITEFRVIDSGIGISEGDLDRIFDDFVTLDSSYSRAAGGTGLGLGIAQRIARGMGGEIIAESVLGEGSLFCLRIPLDLADPGAGGRPGPSAGPERPEGPRVAPMRILVVEDNEVNRIVVRDFLARDGHTVFEAHNGRDGVARAQALEPDLILMDISMPGMNGVEATREIRALAGRAGECPIVALTAHALPADIERFRAAGMGQVLVKPVSRQALRETLDAAMRRAEIPAPPAARAGAGLPLLDRAHFLALFEDLGAERADRLARDFMASVAATLSALERPPVGPQGLEDWIRLVHRLAGSAAVFGTSRFSGALSGLEARLKSGEQVDFRAETTGLRKLWIQTEPPLSEALRSYAAQARPPAGQ